MKPRVVPACARPESCTSATWLAPSTTGPSCRSSTTASTSSPTGTRSPAATPTPPRSSPTATTWSADWIAGGLDPEKSTLFVQSLVPEHAELFLLLSMVIPIPWLERVPTYKEQMEQLAEKDLSTLGFLGYPLLQTADIIIYNAHYVPVGEDQVAAPRAQSRDRAAVPQLLRRAVRRAAAAADEVPAPARPRQPQDVEELRQRHRPGRR